MTLFHSLVLGIVEGATEFLPISSTAHLIIASTLLNLKQTEFVKTFEVLIQTAAILAVVGVYFRSILTDMELNKKILISFIPTGLVGFFLYKIIKNIFFESGGLMITAIFFVGLAFLLIEYLIKTSRIKLVHSNVRMNWGRAVAIGLAQAMAVVPGVSRAGSVMLVMLAMGYKRDESAKYSFLLAVPTITMAGLYDLYQSREVLGQSLTYWPQLAVGLLASFVTAYVVIKWFIGFLQKNSLALFGFYRILLAIILVLSGF